MTAGVRDCARCFGEEKSTSPTMGIVHRVNIGKADGLLQQPRPSGLCRPCLQRLLTRHVPALGHRMKYLMSESRRTTLRRIRGPSMWRLATFPVTIAPPRRGPSCGSAQAAAADGTSSTKALSGGRPNTSLCAKKDHGKPIRRHTMISILNRNRQLVPPSRQVYEE